MRDDIKFNKNESTLLLYIKKLLFNKLIMLITIIILNVLLFTYIASINDFKRIANLSLDNNELVKRMDLDIKKYDDVIYTALNGVGNDEILDKKKNLNEETMEKVRKHIINYISSNLCEKLVEKYINKSKNVHIKVTSYMYYSSGFNKIIKKICEKQCHIDDKINNYTKMMFSDGKYFPIAVLSSNQGSYPFDNSWGSKRNYGGDRAHEGTDIMYSENIADVVPIVSVSDGIIEKKGWLELGGYRLLIRTTNGVKYYYAHLASYANGLEEGMSVKAGQLLGYMGNTGYGVEGTKGKFDVHLHFGMYFNEKSKEIGVNPYFLLKFLAINKLYYK